METHYNNFITTFYKFISDLDRYSPNGGTKLALIEFDKYDIAKLIFRTYHLLKDNIQHITNKSDVLFTSEFVMLPGVDLKLIWPNLIKGQKEKVWTYLSILQIESELLMEHTKDIKTTPVEQPNEDSVQFNPYVGVGGNNSGYGVNEMFSALPKDDEIQSSGPGIETIAKMIGLNKLVNFDELADQLKNMKKEDIESATNNIKELLGNNVDEKTSELFKTMLTDISEEMKNTNLDKGDPFANLLKISENVAMKMKPNIEKNNIDVSQLISSTQVFANQCKDTNGKPLFEGKVNPFSLLASFTNGGEINEEQCMAQCNEMLSSMGVNPNMAQMMGQMMRPNNNNNNNSKRGGKRKKRN